MNEDDFFTRVPNKAMKDNGLDLRDVGLYSFLLHFSDKWNFSIKGLAKVRKKDGEESIRSGIEHLESAGYLKRHKIQRDGSGKFSRQKWEIYGHNPASPVPGKPATVRPPTDGNGQSNISKNDSGIKSNKSNNVLRAENAERHEDSRSGKENAADVLNVPSTMRSGRNSFNNFEQREYDFDELERILLSHGKGGEEDGKRETEGASCGTGEGNGNPGRHEGEAGPAEREDPEKDGTACKAEGGHPAGEAVPP